MQDRNNVLDTDHIGRLLMKLTVPMFFGMLVQAVYSIVDTIFIGRFVGPLGIGALSIVFPLQMFAMGTGSMVGVGGSSLISRLLGGGDRHRAERALGNSIALSILFSAVLTAGVVPFVTFWVKLMGATPDLMPFAHTYMLINYAGVVFNITGNVLLNLVRSEGNARVPMISLIMQSLLNILLDWLFIVVLGWGVKGAAVATLIAQAAGLSYALSYYLAGKGYLKIRFANFVPDARILKAIFAIGVTQFAQSVASTGSAMLLVRQMSAYGSDTSLEIFGVVQRIMWLSLIPGQVLGQSMQPILGFNYGARRFHNANRVMMLAFTYAVAFGFISFGVLYLFPRTVIGVFTNDAALIDAAARASRIIFAAVPLFGFFNVGQLVFPSIGKAAESFIIAIARPLVFITPLVLGLPHFFGINGVWASFPSADALTFVLTLGMLIPLFRKFRQAAKAGQAVVSPTPLPRAVDTGTEIV